MNVILGVGCDRDTSIETLTAAVTLALDASKLMRADVCGVASIDKKNDERCILELAEKNAWPLQFFSAQQLAAVAVPNPSETVRRYMGTPAVAEAAALLAAKTGMENLVLEKLKHRGADGKNATVSIAKVMHE
ncbi:MAG: cobalamin biosynthesis protein [Gammaproteobacteria bacterium]|nr:cobalamin biosynthesis protein [Gammaproteobacteria bacterium]